jgi:hypothetical protein
VVKTGTPPGEHHEREQRRRGDTKNKGGRDENRSPDDLLDNMVAKIGEEIEFRLRMMQLVEFPEQRHFVIEITLHPHEQIEQQPRTEELPPSRQLAGAGDRQSRQSREVVLIPLSQKCDIGHDHKCIQNAFIEAPDEILSQTAAQRLLTRIGWRQTF